MELLQSGFPSISVESLSAHAIPRGSVVTRCVYFKCFWSGFFLTLSLIPLSADVQKGGGKSRTPQDIFAGFLPHPPLLSISHNITTCRFDAPQILRALERKQWLPLSAMSKTDKANTSHSKRGTK